MKLKPRTCTCYGCRRKSNTFWAAYLGVCEYHLKLLADDDYWVGVCWECGSITAVDPKEDLIKDKYIFSKGCIRCTGNEEMNISWMTIKEETKPTTLISPSVAIGGKSRVMFIPITDSSNQLRSGSPPRWDVKLGFTWTDEEPSGANDERKFND